MAKKFKFKNAAPSKSVEPAVKNASRYITSYQLTRLRHDVSMWRTAVQEAEQDFHPQRVKMQRMYRDTVLNGHIHACMARYRDLALLKDFEIKVNGEESEELEDLFEQKRFYDFLNYAIDAQFYGYSLISLGDIIDSQFNQLSMIPREYVSPDRKNVVSYLYMVSGLRFDLPPVSAWHIWIPTHNELGTSDCGYGLLYKIAIYEILLRNLLAYNGDFVEMFSQPYRVGKTNKTEENERSEFENALRSMGSAGYALIDPTDEIEFLETALGGTGFQGYDNLEKRLENKISKMILGHADAMDSVPGKLGAGNGEDNPVSVALANKQSALCRFLENIINGQLIPKMRALGIDIPDGAVFEFSNDAESEAKKRAKAEFSKQVADVALTMKNAGLQMSPAYFEELTDIPTAAMVQPMQQEQREDIMNKVKNYYK
ncbi:MAG TPA: DUF935 family protein [Paludibacteraceae bacterium]|nr:DUF935 family protein [Paludibacteraceae bacterium]